MPYTDEEHEAILAEAVEAARVAARDAEQVKSETSRTLWKAQIDQHLNRALMAEESNRVLTVQLAQEIQKNDDHTREKETLALERDALVQEVDRLKAEAVTVPNIQPPDVPSGGGG